MAVVAQKYHFITGLPRSGSTLLSALLLQNPRFHAGMTSPVGILVNNLITHFGAGTELGSMLSQPQRQRLVRGVFDAYYADKSDKQVIFDTNRSWSASMPLLAEQFPEAKVIACVRNVAWVMDSLERRFRANPYEITRLFGDGVERNTVYSRVETLGQRNRLVGYPWTALKEAFYGEYASRLLIIDYDLLAQAPQKVMPLLYSFIDEPLFDHDFEAVSYEAQQFDAALGVHGLHTVRSKVELQKRRTVLPPDLFAQFNELAFWQNQDGSAASVITIKPTTGC
ncbi:sulfotransferase [Pseudomonas sp. LJDD11]|nr:MULTISPECIES: sulfotransferase [unclassified Pseudomonas]MCO8163561.1 sulfotransferase [Pseudomonas sp. 21LCFQ010]MCQ9426504.1 sulfotransferase [Pseudomonas sp. LJDD11]